MKNINILLFCSLFVIQTFAQKLNLKDITSGKYKAETLESFTSSMDGEFYFRPNASNSAIIKYSYKTGLPTDTIFDTKRARECSFSDFEGFVMSPDEKRLLLYRNSEKIYRHSFKADYYYFDIRRNHVRKLTEKLDKQSSPTFSKDGRLLAYVCNNNIWLAKFDFETESQVTKDGEFNKIINGATDWVYEEEFRTTYMMDFSEDNKLLAFVKFDETDVPEYSMQVFNQQLYPSFKTFKYPKAGEKNSKVSCNVFDIESKTIRQMNIPSETTEYIPRIAFVNDSQLAIMTLNRDQNEFNMYFANARSSVSKLILQEKNDRYINSDFINSIHFFSDQFTYLSEKSGYSHIYLYSNTGSLLKQLTSGNYDVMAILAIDPDSKYVFYSSADDSPLRRNIYKVDFVKGSRTKLSSKVGYNTAAFGSKGKYFINTWSTASNVPISTINDASGKELRIISDNIELKNRYEKLGLATKEFIKIPTEDGDHLNGWIIKPQNYSSSRKYPLVMVQYSGPDSQQVLDQFNIDWTDYLVTQGYIVACVDGRGTGARGENFRKCTYMNLGIKESEDQIKAANYLGTLDYVDKNKIAIWGWSYGGYNVLMSMSNSTIFKAGVAIAPVTDWRYYDTVYAERFMRTPQQNKSGYDNASPIKLANKLQGNLLLIHGSADDNVHYQNSMVYASALIEADKQFEMFTFTDKDHSIRGEQTRSYLYEKVIKFLNANL